MSAAQNTKKTVTNHSLTMEWLERHQVALNTCLGIALLTCTVFGATVFPIGAVWILSAPVAAYQFLQLHPVLSLISFALGFVGFLALPVGAFGGLKIAPNNVPALCFWIVYPVVMIFSYMRLAMAGLPIVAALILSVYCSLAIPTGLLLLLVLIAVASFSALKS